MDDEQAMYHLLTKHHLPICPRKTLENGKIAIEAKGGVSELLAHLKIRLKRADSEEAADRIGVIIDADADSIDESPAESETASAQIIDPYAGLTRRWQSLRDVLRQVGYTDVPEIPNPKGTIVGLNQDERPVIGIWLMPDNQLPGKLENFARLLLPPDDTLWARVERCIRNIPVNERRFKEKDLIKAQMHTWLAWQEAPGKPIGQAITKDFLRADAPHAQTLIAWLKTLYALP